MVNVQRDLGHDATFVHYAVANHTRDLEPHDDASIWEMADRLTDLAASGVPQARFKEEEKVYDLEEEKTDPFSENNGL